eukprot:TRINITY_DN3347_c0_g1_i16.p1 TRINITY_DN3347_c0_g1~~TRINITY_DN3347_c0_g1_i16.p1  ORF type:complete len:553 (-),score=23.88 TRINITY_DN3347_c0_g1_i16:371-2029(-)
MDSDGSCCSGDAADSTKQANDSELEDATSSISSPLEEQNVCGEDLISALPDECIALIFRKLEVTDLASCCLVCKRWLRVDAESRMHIILKASFELSPMLPKLLDRFSSLQKLVLKCEKNASSVEDDALLTIIEYAPNLKKLKLKNCKRITDGGLELFGKKSQSLRKFSCGSCGFGIGGLNALLEHCSTLEDLTVKKSVKPSGEPLQETVRAGAGNLLRLCLKDQSGPHIWTNLIGGSKKLETLILARNGGYWDRVLEATLGQRHLPELSQVYLESVNISDKGLASVAKCPKLEALVVMRAQECTDAGMTVIAQSCRDLRRLHVEGWALGHLSDTGLMAIATHCTQLQELVLVAHSCTVTSMQPLTNNCQLLERLTLSSSESMGDGEVACIAQACPSLRRLCIKSCPRVSDLGIISLAKSDGCPSLQKLKLRRCKGISSYAISFLREHRPAIAILQERKSPASGVDAAIELTGRDESPDERGRSSCLRSNYMDDAHGRQRFARARLALAAGTTYVACTLRRWVAGYPGNGSSSQQGPSHQDSAGRGRTQQGTE